MKFGGTSDVQFRRYDRGQTNTQIQTDRQTDRQTDARHKFTILRFHVGGGVLNEKQRTSSVVLAIASVVTLYHLQGKVLSEPVNATNDCFPKY